jgi:hypothetical protein
MMDFYRQETWRILALQKFLSTAYKRIVFRPTPLLTTKKLTVQMSGEIVRLTWLFREVCCGKTEDGRGNLGGWTLRQSSKICQQLRAA